jgi:hypothetical protein
MYEGIHFCVKGGEDQSREAVEKIICHKWMKFEPLFIEHVDAGGIDATY